MKKSLNLALTRILKSTALLVALFSALSTAEAELEFEKTLIEDIVLSDLGDYPFVFTFKNVGESSVRISSLEFGCGCVIAEVNDRVIDVGGKGVICGNIDLRKRSGEFEVEIRVLTDDISQPAVDLRVALDVEQALRFEPAILFWSADGAGGALEAQLVVAGQRTLPSSVSIRGESKNFDFELLGLDGAVADGRPWVYRITPRDFDSPVSETAIVDVVMDGVSARTLIHLIVD